MEEHKVKKIWERKVKPFIKRDNLILMILAGVLLLIISLPTGKKGDRTNQKENKIYTGVESEGQVMPEEKYGKSLSDTEEAYRKNLQKELEELLSGIDGAGEVRVMVVLKESEEMVVEKDTKKTQRQTGESGLTGTERVASENLLEEDTVQGGTKDPFVIKRIYPKVEGVVVLAKGVGTGQVRSDISQAVQALLGLEAHKIKVLKLGHIKSMK